MNVPSDLKYSSTHEWVRIEGDIATIGITDHAQSELGDVVYVDLPEAGRALSAGDVLGSVESVKAVSDLYAPVTGEVIEANPVLEGRAELVNEDPYGEGYLLKVRFTSLSGELMDAKAYSDFLG